MQAGPLDLGTVAFCRRVIEDPQRPILGRVELLVQQGEDDGSQGGGLAADAVEEVVIGSELVADRCGPPPTRDGAATVS